jgi:hypothetical protein
MKILIRLFPNDRLSKNKKINKTIYPPLPQARLSQLLRLNQKRRRRLNVVYLKLQLQRVFSLCAALCMFSIAFLGYSSVSFELMFLFAMESKQTLSALVFFITFCTAYRVGSYERPNIELLKISKMQAVLTRFEGRVLKWRKNTKTERPERFDTVMQDINKFFLQREREAQLEKEQEQDDELLRKYQETGIIFDDWFAEKQSIYAGMGPEELVRNE